MKRLWLVSHDIADDRRRRRVDGVLLGLGDRVQESLFECALSYERAHATARRLALQLDEKADSMALLPVCRDCLRRARFFGLGRDRERPAPHFTQV